MKKFLMAAGAALILSTQAFAASNIGVVSFKECIDESKAGKQEQASLDALRKQLQSTLEGTEKELAAIVNKIQDPDYVDSLSPEGEEDLKDRYQALMQERGNQQQQFYQILSQAEYKTLAELNVHVSRAAQIVAKEKKLDFVLRDEAAFYFPADADITKDIIAEMDKLHDQEKKDS